MGLIALIVVCFAAPIGAQVFLHAISVADVKVAGVAQGFFRKPVHYWNAARGGANFSTASQTWNDCTNCAEYDVDMGTVQAQGGIMVGTLTARPTCAVGLRGRFYTLWTANNGGSPSNDAGVKDATAQCCKAAIGTYSWVTGGCQ